MRMLRLNLLQGFQYISYSVDNGCLGYAFLLFICSSCMQLMFLIGSSLSAMLKARTMERFSLFKFLQTSSMENRVSKENSSSKESVSLHTPSEDTNPCFKLIASDSIKVSNCVVQQTSCSYSVSIAMPSSPSRLDQLKSTSISKEETIQNPLTLKGNSDSQSRISTSSSMKDKRFDSFKTWSGRLERQFSSFGGKPTENNDLEAGDSEPKVEHVPEVDRYFAALQGPELDTLRPSEISVLPEDKLWPFLLRFPISSFGMCLGVSSQAILWKSIAEHGSLFSPKACLLINFILWCISIVLMSTVSIIYILKMTLYFEAVKREYYHPIRVNFFFAPWIAFLFLAQGVPPLVAFKLDPILWYILMTPIFCLELKIYGQWMSGGKRRLSKVANPSNHLSIVGNFVGALLGANMGMKEGPLFFFAVGLAHYTVLFVTLYQRLPTNTALPKDLHPVFFLFVAAPSIACVAWSKISGNFDYGSRLAYFVALFLYLSLVVRINFFRGFRFSLAWWAYTFPMTGAAIATINYYMKVMNMFTRSLSIGLSTIAAVVALALFVTTVVYAFALHDLFPNDVAIAITDKRPKFSIKHRRMRMSSLNINEIAAAIVGDETKN